MSVCVSVLLSENLDRLGGLPNAGFLLNKAIQGSDILPFGQCPNVIKCTTQNTFVLFDASNKTMVGKLFTSFNSK